MYNGDALSAGVELNATSSPPRMGHTVRTNTELCCWMIMSERKRNTCQGSRTSFASSFLSGFEGKLLHRSFQPPLHIKAQPKLQTNILATLQCNRVSCSCTSYPPTSPVGWPGRCLSQNTSWWSVPPTELSHTSWHAKFPFSVQSWPYQINVFLKLCLAVCFKKHPNSNMLQHLATHSTSTWSYPPVESGEKKAWKESANSIWTAQTSCCMQALFFVCLAFFAVGHRCWAAAS